MLGILEQQSLKEMVVCLDAAIQGLLRDRYSKEKDLARVLMESRRRVDTPGTTTACYRPLLSLVYGIEGADFDPLLPFLEACETLWPYAESVGSNEALNPPAVQSTQDLLLLAVAEGSMHEYFKPHPEVEEWIARLADRIRDVLLGQEGVGGGDRDRRLALVLGTAVTLHDLLGGLAPYFQQIQDKGRKEYSFVAHVISDIRRALLWTVLRDLPLEGDDFPQHRVKRFALPSRAEFRYVRLFLERLAADQEDLEEIAAARRDFEQLPVLAQALRGCPFLDGAGPERKEMDRVLPFGQIALVQMYGPAHEHVVYYTADGVAHQTHLAHSCPDREQGTDVDIIPLLPADGGWTWEGVLGCRQDDQGKVHFGRVDRLAPPAEDGGYQEAAQVIGRAAAACHRSLLQEWENYPELFARLDTLGPVVLVRTPTATILLCRSDAEPAIQVLRGWRPQEEEETRALLDRIRMRTPGPWAGLILQQRGAVQPEHRTTDLRKMWRAKIRKQMERERIPNFRRLVEKLAPFGVHETTRGKGSHGTLCLEGKEERNQTTWYALRHKADPLPIPYVWECLERLGISYQEFYESLAGC
jgi:hypothetical protein